MARRKRGDDVSRYAFIFNSTFSSQRGGVTIKVVNGGEGYVNMMNVLTRRLLSSWWDFYQGAVGVWRGWARSRARADLIRICDRFNVSLRKSD